MNNAGFRELEQRASKALEFDLLRQAETHSRVAAEIEAMKADGTAIALSDEEICMLHMFRRFKLRMRKNGEVFTWQTQKPDGIVIAEETAEIVHPSEAASYREAQ